MPHTIGRLPTKRFGGYEWLGLADRGFGGRDQPGADGSPVLLPLS